MAVILSRTRIAPPPAARGLARRRLAEFFAVVLAALGAALLLALASYNPADPSFDTATAERATNLAGPVGATLSDLLLQGFGVAGVMPAAALLAWAWRLASGRGLGSPILRIGGLAVGLPSLATTLAILPLSAPGVGENWPSSAGLGGAAGHMLGTAALHAAGAALGPLGTGCVLLAAVVLALAGTGCGLGLSFRDWRAAGRGTARGVRGLGDGAAGAARFSAGIGRGAAQGLARVGAVLSPVFGGEEDEVLTRVRPAAPASARPTPAAEPAEATPEKPAQLTRAARAKIQAERRTVPPARQESLNLPEAGWRYPPISLLKAVPPRASVGPSEDVLQANARLLESVLGDYGVQGAIRDIRPGPVVTLYELEPAPGIRSSRVIGLADDIARSLSVTAVRIATVPGRNVIGIEVPNAKRETVYLSELMDTPEWERNSGRLPLALGKDIGGVPVIADLARMPHLLIAGTTGSGKSVGINAMILSLVFKMPPDQCRLILIDPKMLELSVYEGIPHLMAPVVTEPAKAVAALKWTVREMERRYRAMSQLSVRNIGGYNDRVAEAQARGEVVTRRVQTGFDPETNRAIYEEQPLALEKLPLICVVIDEMADLMMVAGKEIEAAVQRLAQMARAAGIHVIMATQRPSVDVITGTIKANFPTRISFQVISKFDSRTILGEQGSEQLLGMGDMLYMQGGGRITRVHGPFVTDREVEDVVAFLREQGEPAYLDEVTEPVEDEPGDNKLPMGMDGGEVGLFDQAVAVVAREGKASTSFIQRHLNIGYNRAAKLIEQMEKEGIVSAANHVGRREVLVRRTEE